MRVDGGASVMDLMLQMQADQLGIEVARPVSQQTTAMGAAFLAGLAEGVWDSTDDLAATWRLDASFQPSADADTETGRERWLNAVERSRNWDHSEAAE